MELVSFDMEVSTVAVVLVGLIIKIRSLLLQRKPLTALERRLPDVRTDAALDDRWTRPTGSMPADIAAQDWRDDFGVVPRFRRSALL
ncbi:hypothetical protein GCM10007170_25320 [Arthrobacter liuii]|uniref:Uncharacterized protein n=1 Tax=Arthrobacter liuii TaxID=1476996 RepID=A0ABQ2ASM6_9MICC|nr:hypothetical protein GCM10007170_25320 [Arthrobacter liuii]